MAHPIITLLPWVPPSVPHITPPRYITLAVILTKTLDLDLGFQDKNKTSVTQAHSNDMT